MDAAGGATRRQCLTGLGLTGLGLTGLAGAARAGPARDAEQPPVPGLAPEAAGRVRAVDGAGRLILADGRRVKLVAVGLPRRADLPHDAAAAEVARVRDRAAAAYRWLREAVEDRAVRLWTPEVARDRHGRVLAQVVTAEAGLWVQAALVARGLARVATMPGAADGAGALLRREAAARAGRRGLWAEALYAPRTPAQTWPWIGTFQIVRGTVLDAARVRARVYLNFGPDWRRDFTVMVDRPRRAGLAVEDLLDLKRQFIQVRGWLFPMNGPMIALDHPEALERRVRLGPGVGPR